MDELARWFMTAPLPVIFAAGVVLGVPLWLLATGGLSGKSRAQQMHERALSAGCPRCAALPGRRCLRKNGHTRRVSLHLERM
jgi:hypothetical protein